MPGALVVAAGLALAAGAGLSGCSSQGQAALATLRRDPMATITPAGVTSQSVTEHAGGTSLGMPVPTSLLRELHVSDLPAAPVELDRDARAAGWLADSPLSTSEAGRMELDVLRPGPDADEVQVVLTVHMPG